MKKLMLLFAMVTILAGCSKENPVAPISTTTSFPTMEWYAAHQEDVATTSLEDMADIINRAYATYPDSAVGPVRAFIWEELKSRKTAGRKPEPMSVQSYSIFDLNWQETLVLMSEPWNGPATSTCRTLAVNEANRQWPTYSQIRDKADGFRHAYWNILMCRRISEDWARKLSTAHEYGSPNGLLDAQMDLNNNGIGRALWRSYGWSKSESQYSTIVKDWQYVKVTSFSGAVPYIIYLSG